MYRINSTTSTTAQTPIQRYTLGNNTNEIIYTSSTAVPPAEYTQPLIWNASTWSDNTIWSGSTTQIEDPKPEPLSPFADARTARVNLQQQLDLLLSLEDGLVDSMAERFSDAIYFLRESIENLDKILA